MKKVEGARYYDGVNFARLITCPSWFSFGYNDDVVPPTSAYATYNVVTAPKTLSVYHLSSLLHSFHLSSLLHSFHSFTPN